MIFDGNSSHWTRVAGRVVKGLPVGQGLALISPLRTLLGPRQPYTPLSESRSGLGKVLEDLGPILAVLAVLVLMV